jgi:hypothetical protein
MHSSDSIHIPTILQSIANGCFGDKLGPILAPSAETKVPDADITLWRFDGVIGEELSIERSLMLSH